MFEGIYRVAQKWHSFFWYAVTSSKLILTDLRNYFTVRIRRKCVIIILSPKIPPHLKCVATLPCEMSSVLKATFENKTTSATTHFKEINKEQHVYCLSYCLNHNHNHK